MSPKEKKKLERLKTLKVRSDIPEELGVAIESFMQQAIIIGEYELDYMPAEYLSNLLQTLVKYPEHEPLLMEIIDTLERDSIIEN